MKQWQDNTRKDTIKSSSIQFGRFKLVVHRCVGYPDDMWLASSYGIFENKELASKDLDQAKCQAFAILQSILEQALDEMFKSI